MKIVILAAGKGERLLPLTQNTPKPLLDMGQGKTLLEEQIVNIMASEVIDEICLVIGYLSDQIEAKMHYYRGLGLRIRTLFNPFFHVSNNLMSLWLSRSLFAEDDLMVTNGDNIFAPEIFRDFAQYGDAHGEGVYLALNRKETFDTDDMKVFLSDGLVARVGKTLPQEQWSAESPGLCMVRGKRARALFAEHLDKLARKEEYLNRFWLEVFGSLYDSGVPIHPWFFGPDHTWQEVDFHMDISKARELLLRLAREPKKTTVPR